MRITSCVPLAGQGVIARFGGLVAVTDGHGPDPDPLLRAVAETAEGTGDGSDLVIRAARAALSTGRQAGWACAGVTADGGLAVLVHGHAAATVRVDGGPEVTLTVSETMLPVSRTFTGATVAVILVIGGAAAPDERFWLGDGVVHGGGLAVTATAVTEPVGRPPVGRAPVDRPPVDRAPVDRAPVGRVAGEPAGRAASHPPTMDTPVLGVPEVRKTVTDPPPQAMADDPPAVLVEGVLCVGGHFNDPDGWSCRQCGIALDRPPQHVGWRPRPPLGELVLDDGTRITLDGNYVLGREPALDGDVVAGLARPLRINDPNGTVSRHHLKVSLVGWRVEVSDLGSANGSFLRLSGEEHALTPFEPTTIEPGAWIGIGHRSMQYVAYQGA